MTRATLERLAVAAAVVGLAAVPSTGAQPEGETAGVGVTVSTIAVDQPLAAGGVYRLPSIGVVNTGGLPALYGLAVTHLADQRELPPPPEWFRFDPAEVDLAPGEVGNVDISLRIPASAQTGPYFAYVEAFPLSQVGGTVVGVAAATRLSFTVAAGGGFGDRLARWARGNQTPLRVAGLIVAAILLGLLAWRYLPVRIRVERRR